MPLRLPNMFALCGISPDNATFVGKRIVAWNNEGSGGVSHDYARSKVLFAWGDPNFVKVVNSQRSEVGGINQKSNLDVLKRICNARETNVVRAYEGTEKTFSIRPGTMLKAVAHCQYVDDKDREHLLYVHTHKSPPASKDQIIRFISIHKYIFSTTQFSEYDLLLLDLSSRHTSNGSPRKCWASKEDLLPEDVILNMLDIYADGFELVRHLEPATRSPKKTSQLELTLPDPETP